MRWGEAAMQRLTNVNAMKQRQMDLGMAEVFVGPNGDGLSDYSSRCQNSAGAVC